MSDTNTTSQALRRRPVADSTPVVHVAIASYIADHDLRVATIHIPRLPGQKFELWIRDVDLEDWHTAGVRLRNQAVRPSSSPTHVVVAADADLDLALGTVTVELHWIEEKTLSRRLQMAAQS